MSCFFVLCIIWSRQRLSANAILIIRIVLPCFQRAVLRECGQVSDLDPAAVRADDPLPAQRREGARQLHAADAEQVSQIVLRHVRKLYSWNDQDKLLDN